MKAIEIRRSGAAQKFRSLQTALNGLSRQTSRIRTGIHENFGRTLAKSSFFSELCSAKFNDRVTIPQGNGYCSDILSGFFYARYNTQPSAVISKIMYALRSTRSLSLATGYDSRFSVSNAKLNNQMETTIRPVRTLSLRAALANLSESTRKPLLAIASCLSMLTVIGVAIGSDRLTWIPAAGALLILAADEMKKGGDR